MANEIQLHTYGTGLVLGEGTLDNGTRVSLKRESPGVWIAWTTLPIAASEDDFLDMEGVFLEEGKLVVRATTPEEAADFLLDLLKETV